VSGLERGSLEWAVGVVASTLAEGTPQRVVTPSDVEEGADVFVAAFLEAGYEQVPMPSGVWGLTFLSPGEALGFARGALGWLVEAQGLEIEWDPEGTA
jgi:hypothetical protein